MYMEAALQFILQTFVAASTLASQEALKEASKDLYQRLRNALVSSIKDESDIKKLEESPERKSRQQVVLEDLQEALAEADVPALTELAEALSQALKVNHSEVYHAFRLDLQRAKVAGSVNVNDNEVDGGMRIDAGSSTIGKDFNVRGNKVKKS